MSTSRVTDRLDDSQFEHKGEALEVHNSRRDGQGRFALNMPENTPFKKTATWVYDVCLARLTQRNCTNFFKDEGRKFFGDYKITTDNFLADCDSAKDVSSVVAAVGKLAVNFCIISPAASAVRLAKMAIKGTVHLLKNLVLILGISVLITAKKCKNGIVNAVEWCKENPKKALALGLLATAAVILGVYFAPVSLLVAGFVKAVGVTAAVTLLLTCFSLIINTAQYRHNNKLIDKQIQASNKQQEQIINLTETLREHNIEIPDFDMVEHEKSVGKLPSVNKLNDAEFDSSYMEFYRNNMDNSRVNNNGNEENNMPV